jgi:hypothetical protein
LHRVETFPKKKQCQNDCDEWIEGGEGDDGGDPFSTGEGTVVKNISEARDEATENRPCDAFNGKAAPLNFFGERNKKREHAEGGEDLALLGCEQASE